MPADFGLLECQSGATITTYNRHRTWHPATVAISLILIFTAIAATNGVPTMSRNHYRRIRETFVDFEAKAQNETHPEGTCILDGVLVPKATVHCEMKSGCRAIEKTGYCCRDYKCDCEKDGRLYSNGEKLVDPETPCKVCYCQGGDILCSSVSCYKRDDCEPKFIPGRCCPEYDNCPVPESSTTLDKSKSENTSTLSPSLTTKSVPSVTTAKPEEMLNNPLGIKIKEITKPGEIKIVDKPKQISPRPKPVETSVANQLKIHLTKDINQPIILVDAQTQTDLGTQMTSRNAELTTASHQSPASTNSEFEEVSTSTHSTVKIVRHAEVVIVENGNGESKHFTVFGTKGLQRGVDNADEDKIDPETLSIETEVIYDNSDRNHHEGNVKSTNDFDPLPSGSDHIYRIAVSTERSTSDRTTEGSFSDSTLTKTSPAINEIFDSVLYTSGPFKFSEENDTSSEAYLEPFYHEIVNESNGTLTTENDAFLESSGSTPTNIIHGHHPIDEDDTSPIDSNPAYPIIIEEDLSNYPRVVEDYPEHAWHKAQNIALKEEQRSSSVHNKMTTDGPMDLNKFDFKSTDTTSEGSLKMRPMELTTEGAMTGIAEPRSPGEPCLVPEWERNSSTLCNYNFTESMFDETFGQHNESVEPSKIENMESLDIEIDSGSGSGSGSGSVIGLSNREPTTPKYKKIRVIDDLGILEDGTSNDSEILENDPKDDVESLKYDESDSLSESSSGGSAGPAKDLLNKDKIKLFHE